MATRRAWALCFATLAFSHPAIAGETWDCTVHLNLSPGATEVTPEHGPLVVENDDLIWEGLHDHFHIAVNNDVGVVAVFAQATATPAGVKVSGLPPDQNARMQAYFNSRAPKQLINSYTIALNKQDGSMRIGSVGTTAVRDISTGTCQRAAAAPEAGPPNTAPH